MRRLAIILLLAGCATAPSSPPSPATVDLTGTWKGHWMLSGIGSGDAWATLEQSGANVTGVLRFNAPDSNPGGPVEGTVEGNVLTFLWTHRYGRVPGHFEVRGDGIRGTTQGQYFIRWYLQRGE